MLGHPAVLVATATRTPGVGPDAAVWSPVARDNRSPGAGRLGLATLADLPLDTLPLGTP